MKHSESVLAESVTQIYLCVKNMRMQKVTNLDQKKNTDTLQYIIQTNLVLFK